MSTSFKFCLKPGRCIRASVYVNACMRSCVHVCMRACVHSCMRTCQLACLHSCVASMRTCVFCLRELHQSRCDWLARCPIYIWGKPTFGFLVLLIMLSECAGALHAVLLSQILEDPGAGPPMHLARQTHLAEHILWSPECGFSHVSQDRAVCCPWLVLQSGCPGCSMSSPGLVDGLPPVANLLL